MTNKIHSCNNVYNIGREFLATYITKIYLYYKLDKMLSDEYSEA